MVRSNATVRDPRHPAHEPPSYQLGHGSRCQAKLAPTLSSPPYSTYSEGIHPQTSWRPSARCSAPDVVQFQSSAFLFSVLIPVDHVCNSKFKLTQWTYYTAVRLTQMKSDSKMLSSASWPLAANSCRGEHTHLVPLLPISCLAWT